MGGTETPENEWTAVNAEGICGPQGPEWLDFAGVWCFQLVSDQSRIALLTRAARHPIHHPLKEKCNDDPT